MRVAVLLSLLLPAAAQADDALTLERAIDMARSRHPTVEAQRAQVMIASARRQQSAASLWPFVTGSFAYQPQTPNFAATPSQRHSSTSGVATVLDGRGQQVTVSCPLPGQGSCLPAPLKPPSYALSDWWTAGVGVSWTAWDWGRSIFGYRSARSVAEATGVGVVTAQRNVVLDVQLAFFAVVAAEEQVKVGEESVISFRKQLEQVRAFHDTGLRTGIDVATSESGLANAELTLTRARAGVETTRAQLSVALGEDTRHPWRLVLPPDVFELQPRDEARARAPAPALIETALRQRSELQQLSLIERSYRQLVRSYRGQYLPQLALSVGPSWAGVDLSSLTRNYSVTLALEYPTGGMSPVLVRGQVREAEGNLLATLAQERATRDSIRQETISASALLASAREEMLAARKLVAAATAQRDLATGRYATGVGTIIELTNAVLTYVNARFQLVQAGYDLASARAQLQHALGEDI